METIGVRERMETRGTVSIVTLTAFLFDGSFGFMSNKFVYV